MPVLDVQAMTDALLTIPQGQDLHMVLRKFRACTAADYDLANKMLLPALYRSAYRFLRSDGEIALLSGKGVSRPQGGSGVG